MSYSDRFRSSRALSTREKLESLMPNLLNNVEMVSGYSISQWRVARTMAWATNSDVPKDLYDAHQQITDSIVMRIRAIAETFLINTEARVDEETKVTLSNALLQCGVLTERLRPIVGEGWPPSPAAGTRGDRALAEKMIEQVRAEVMRCQAIDSRRISSGRG